MALLEVDELCAEFHLRRGRVRAVDAVSLTLDPGETLAVVGESGSGKSTLALSIMQLNPQPPCVYPAGRITHDGRDLLGRSDRELRGLRGAEIAMIFQDPISSLNPVQAIGRQIAEAVRIHQGVPRAQAWRAAVEALGEVGVANPERRATEYPHQYSGGMRQRAMIAMALACRPKVLIADEPTTALDVTIQAQILELLAELQQRHGTAILLITHDLGIVAQVADRVLVMYAGRTVETGTVDQVFGRPMMPYTASLLGSTPRLDAPEGTQLLPVAGQPPSLLEIPPGCSFAPRCPFVRDACTTAQPPLAERAPGHRAACIVHPDQLDRERGHHPEAAQP